MKKYTKQKMDKRTQKTIIHSHRHQHDDQQHTHQHENNKKEHSHEHKHPAIIYPDERGYTIIELNRDDLKLWMEDEMKFSDGN